MHAARVATVKIIKWRQNGPWKREGGFFGLLSLCLLACRFVRTMGAFSGLSEKSILIGSTWNDQMVFAIRPVQRNCLHSTILQFQLESLVLQGSHVQPLLVKPKLTEAANPQRIIIYMCFCARKLIMS